MLRSTHDYVCDTLCHMVIRIVARADDAKIKSIAARMEASLQKENRADFQQHTFQIISAMGLQPPPQVDGTPSIVPKLPMVKSILRGEP
jgi:hypothetical protein